ncbi:hypothetical protein SFHH103_psfHH103d_374 (plasmid) [Sinorhizobium fredii HH103]|nr:hypothetical protein SFHH103_04273 [Sinorhizobium fredii HH103]CEO91576.1 hypothetical protein SFHH103_psfHH103d_374 [Sinorhizobium fredii HH103]
MPVFAVKLTGAAMTYTVCQWRTGLARYRTRKNAHPFLHDRSLVLS